MKKSKKMQYVLVILTVVSLMLIFSSGYSAMALTVGCDDIGDGNPNFDCIGEDTCTGWHPEVTNWCEKTCYDLGGGEAGKANCTYIDTFEL